MSNDFRRIEFTEEDDQNLIKFIAEKIPYLETGGRLGNNLYLELVKNVRPQVASIVTEILCGLGWMFPRALLSISDMSRSSHNVTEILVSLGSKTLVAFVAEQVQNTLAYI